MDIKGLREIGSAAWLQERFPEKDWHRHRRTDGRFDLCDGTPSDCPSKPRLPLDLDEADHAARIERFRKALMEAHADDWSMETIAEAAHICARAGIK